jgi:hypothetical protein
LEWLKDNKTTKEPIESYDEINWLCIILK